MNKIIKHLSWIVFLLFTIYIIYQILRAVLGGSWETENIIVGGVGIIITGTFTIVAFMFNQSQTLGRLEERTKYFESKFLDIESHLVKIENKFLKYEDKLQIIDNRLIIMERKI